MSGGCQVDSPILFFSRRFIAALLIQNSKFIINHAIFAETIAHISIFYELCRSVRNATKQKAKKPQDTTQKLSI